MPLPSPDKADALVATLVDQINRGLRFDEIFANLYAHLGDALPYRMRHTNCLVGCQSDYPRHGMCVVRPAVR